jgi:hypothetical protein
MQINKLLSTVFNSHKLHTCVTMEPEKKMIFILINREQYRKMVVGMFFAIMGGYGSILSAFSVAKDQSVDWLMCGSSLFIFSFGCLVFFAFYLNVCLSMQTRVQWCCWCNWLFALMTPSWYEWLDDSAHGLTAHFCTSLYLLILLARSGDTYGRNDAWKFGLLLYSMFCALMCCIYCRSTHTRRYQHQTVQPLPIPHSTIVISIRVRARESRDEVHNVVHNVVYEFMCDYADSHPETEGGCGCAKCQCAICLEGMHNKSVISFGSCVHSFHHKCWLSYLSTANNVDRCPVCRQSTTSHL